MNKKHEELSKVLETQELVRQRCKQLRKSDDPDKLVALEIGEKKYQELQLKVEEIRNELRHQIQEFIPYKTPEERLKEIQEEKCLVWNWMKEIGDSTDRNDYMEYFHATTRLKELILEEMNIRSN